MNTSAEAHMMNGNMPIGKRSHVIAWKATTTTYAGTRVRRHKRKATMVVSKRKPDQLKR